MEPNAAPRSDATTGEIWHAWRSSNARSRPSASIFDENLVELIKETPISIQRHLRAILKNPDKTLFAEDIRLLVGEIQIAGEVASAISLLNHLETALASKSGWEEAQQKIAELRDKITHKASFGDKFENQLRNFTREAMHPASLVTLWIAPELGLRGRAILGRLFSRILPETPSLIGLLPKGLSLSGALALESGIACLGADLAASSQKHHAWQPNVLEGNFQKNFLGLLLFRAGSATVFFGISPGLARLSAMKNPLSWHLAQQVGQLASFAVSRKLYASISKEAEGDNNAAVDFFHFWLLSRLNFSRKWNITESPTQRPPSSYIFAHDTFVPAVPTVGSPKHTPLQMSAVAESRGSGNSGQWKRHIRPFAAEDYDGTHRVLTRAFPGWNSSLEEIKFQDRNLDPKCRMQRWVLEYDGAIIGMAEYSQIPQMYHPRKFLINIAVDPAFQGKGIGIALLRHLTAKLRALKPLSVRAEIQAANNIGMSFLKKNGFREDMHVHELTLDLPQVANEALQNWKAGVRASEIEIYSLEKLKGIPGVEKKLHALMVSLMKDQPQPEPHTPLPFQAFLDNVYNNPRRPHEGFFVAVRRGEFVGMSHLLVKNDKLVMNRLTGVLPQYRQLGLATALKAHGIEYAKLRGYQKMQTVNVSTNEAMIRANLKVGYILERTWVSLMKDLSNSKP